MALKLISIRHALILAHVHRGWVRPENKKAASNGRLVCSESGLRLTRSFDQWR